MMLKIPTNGEGATPAPLPLIEVLIVADAWSAEPRAESIVIRALQAAAECASPGEGASELAVMLTDDAGIRTLNANWRGIDKPTNVLSFPAISAPLPPRAGDPPRMLGDIAIAYETVCAEAATELKPFSDHLSHLAIHGYLHLVGYDHETDHDAEAMEQFERDILSRIGIADPYADEAS